MLCDYHKHIIFQFSIYKVYVLKDLLISWNPLKTDI